MYKVLVLNIWHVYFTNQTFSNDTKVDDLDCGLYTQTHLREFDELWQR